MTYRYRKEPTNRQLKVAQLIRQEISVIFIRGDVHPSIDSSIITVSDVKISPDLKIATVFLCLSKNTTDNTKLFEILNHSSSEFRRIVSKSTSLKYSPEIRFVEDKYRDEQINMEKVLNKISQS
ncbi:MAG: ribosome-binding factor A [Candidatus Midichloriaceae bacterium]|jgi:ribosome-binding factor A